MPCDATRGLMGKESAMAWPGEDWLLTRMGCCGEDFSNRHPLSQLSQQFKKNVLERQTRNNTLYQEQTTRFLGYRRLLFMMEPGISSAAAGEAAWSL